MIESILPVKISEEAQKEIHDVLDSKKIPDGYGLRIGIRGSGCAGVSYVMGFDEPMENDATYSLNEIPIYIQKKDLLYLAGVEIDFVNDHEKRGFTFTNNEL